MPRQTAIDLEPRYLVQMSHLTTPATVWRYVEKAVTSSRANLVMLDLEDSIPRDDPELLERGRQNVVAALNQLDWGNKLRFFRPRGTELDPGHDDIEFVVSKAGSALDGLVYPKVEAADEVTALDRTLEALESRFDVPRGRIRIELLIESVEACEQVFEITRVSRRLAGLIFGSYDYWASLGLRPAAYRFDHPLLNDARVRIIKAAALAGVPAIAEMTTNYPTRDKTEEERRAAVDEFRRDAKFARDFGFAGKWTGIPEQAEMAAEIFRIPDDEIERAVNETKLFLESERLGRGAAMIGGRMADRAMDRLNRLTLKTALAMGRLDPDLARDLGVP
jgi:citrate lyase subunit beta/citryl-CoA lyase